MLRKLLSWILLLFVAPPVQKQKPKALYTRQGYPTRHGFELGHYYYAAKGAGQVWLNHGVYHAVHFTRDGTPHRRDAFSSFRAAKKFANGTPVDAGLFTVDPYAV